MRVLLIDDHPLIRASMKQLLDRFPGCVVEEAMDAATAMARLPEGWDLILLDIDLPDRGGLDLLADIRAFTPKTPVLVLSGHPEAEFGRRALKAGAAGYIHKLAPLEEIDDAVRRVLSGRKFVSPDLAASLADEIAGDVQANPREALSQREFEVLRMLGTGATPSEIAQRLGLSIKTVSTYRSRILEKLNLRTTGELVRYAVRNELV